MLIHTSSHYSPNFQPPLSCSYDEALRMTRSGAPLGAEAYRWYADVLLGRGRAIQEPRRLGVAGLSVVSHHVMFALLGSATEDWLLHLPRGLKDIQRLTGYGERSARRALAELNGQAAAGPHLLHTINGAADGHRVFQFLAPPLTAAFTTPIRRASRGLTAAEAAEQRLHMYAFERARRANGGRTGAGRGGPERKPSSDERRRPE